MIDLVTIHGTVGGHWLLSWEKRHISAFLHFLSFTAFWFSMLALGDIGWYVGTRLHFSRSAKKLPLGTVKPSPPCLSPDRLWQALRDDVVRVMIAWMAIVFYLTPRTIWEQILTLTAIFLCSVFFTTHVMRNGSLFPSSLEERRKSQRGK